MEFLVNSNYRPALRNWKKIPSLTREESFIMSSNGFLVLRYSTSGQYYSLFMLKCWMLSSEKIIYGITHNGSIYSAPSHTIFHTSNTKWANENRKMNNETLAHCYWMQWNAFESASFFFVCFISLFEIYFSVLYLHKWTLLQMTEPHSKYFSPEIIIFSLNLHFSKKKSCLRRNESYLRMIHTRFFHLFI